MIRGVYLVLDPDATLGRSPLAILEAALSGGVRAVQWRQKGGSLATAWPAIVAAREACRAARVPFIVNDRVDVALAVDADGAHVGREDLPAQVARRLLPDRLLGVSVTGPDELSGALLAAPDYLGVGPIYPTASKLDAAPAGSLDLLRAVRARTNLPLVAIGGLSPETAPEALRSGADAIAVISAICGTSDPESATRKLAEIAEGAYAQ